MEICGEKFEVVIKDFKEGDVLLVENICYEDLDGKKEFKNDLELGKYWVFLGDVFVNDVFGIVYCEYVFNVGIFIYLEIVVGFLMDKEIKFIGGVVNDLYKLVVVILGGVKVFDKINVIKNLVNIVDKIIIGGGMVYIFLKV